MPVAYSLAAVEAIMRYTWNGQRCENTLWFETVGGTAPSPAELATLGADLHSWYQTYLIPFQGSVCVLNEIYLRQAVAEGGVELTVPGDLLDVGSAGGDPEAGNVTLTVSFRTGLSGRSYRGRNYSIGMTKSHQSGGTASSTYVEGLEDAYSELKNIIDTSGDFVWIVYSQYDGVNEETGNPIPRLTPLTTPISTAIVVDDRTDSQRRRLRARGA